MPGQIKIDDGSGNYTILTNGGSLSSDKTITIPNTTGTMALTSDITSGLSSAQQFRLTANITSSGTNDITSNLEVPDTENQGNMGSLVSESSGIFTFSETGYYAVIVQASAFAKQTRVLTLATDDNSTYTQVAWAGVITDTEGVAGGFSMVILDVTNTTNDKVKFQSYMQTSGGTVYGSSTSSNTSFTFLKLGAT
tara:strand:+ start:259 stop:843 length:585 start_codon:yes stop_codon:yes gene_type:complete